MMYLVDSQVLTTIYHRKCVGGGLPPLPKKDNGQNSLKHNSGTQRANLRHYLSISYSAF